MIQASWRAIYRTFGKGLFAVLPIAITLYALYWLGAIFEQLFNDLIRYVVGDWYYPGMGFALGLVLIFLAGAALNVWGMRALYEWLENLIDRIPMVKSIYGSVRDLLSFFADSQDQDTRQVVVATFGEGPHRMQLLGFITRERFDNLPQGLGDDTSGEYVAVYFPMSYQIGGYTILLPRESLQPIDMTTEQALRFAVTAGMSTEKAKPAAAPQSSGQSA
jgi:uncharacterized membrane protein